MRKTIFYLLSINIYFILAIMKISQNYSIWYISQCLRNILSKIVKKIVAIFSTLLFSIISKMFNMLEFIMVFEIIHY